MAAPLSVSDSAPNRGLFAATLRPIPKFQAPGGAGPEGETSLRVATEGKTWGFLFVCVSVGFPFEGRAGAAVKGYLRAAKGKGRIGLGSIVILRACCLL